MFVEGKIKSGGMHTVHAALMQGREVFAVPGYVGTSGSEGPHELLREGARIVTCADDLLDDLGLKKPAPTKQELVSLTILQQKMVQALQTERLTPQEIAQIVHEDPTQIITELGTLEIMGVVYREAGNRFYLPITARQ